jgi:hypothetical protein
MEAHAAWQRTAKARQDGSLHADIVPNREKSADTHANVRPVTAAREYARSQPPRQTAGETSGRATAWAAPSVLATTPISAASPADATRSSDSWRLGRRASTTPSYDRATVIAIHCGDVRGGILFSILM